MVKEITMLTIVFVLVGIGLALERAHERQKWQTILTLLLTGYIAGGWFI